MNAEELKELFETHSDKYGKFKEIVKSPFSKRADLHAFILLDKLIQDESDIVSAAEHDTIYLDVDFEMLAEVITEEQVIELASCGVFVDDEEDCLRMFA